MFWLFAAVVVVLAVYNKGFRTFVIGVFGLAVLVIGVWYIHDRWTASHWGNDPLVQDAPIVGKSAAAPFDPDAYLAAETPHAPKPGAWPPLPPGFTVDQSATPPLPPGFTLDKPAEKPRITKPLVDCEPIWATIKKAKLAGNTVDATTLSKYLLTVRCR